MKIPAPHSAKTIAVSSPHIAEGQPIPSRHTCAGAGVSPPLEWSGVPGGAASVAVVVSDPDAPRGTFLHWLIYDLPGADGTLAEGTVPAHARECENSARRIGWYPPCPPQGTHRYIFAVYAIDTVIGDGTAEHVLDEISRHAVAWGTLTGLVSAR